MYKLYALSYLSKIYQLICRHMSLQIHASEKFILCEYLYLCLNFLFMSKSFYINLYLITNEPHFYRIYLVEKSLYFTVIILITQQSCTEIRLENLREYSARLKNIYDSHTHSRRKHIDPTHPKNYRDLRTHGDVWYAFIHKVFMYQKYLRNLIKKWIERTYMLIFTQLKLWTNQDAGIRPLCL